MSYGLTPADFVQQVYYAQEKVKLDFWPSDDKYKEVLLEANLVLQELQNVEDWSWLRERLILGPVFAGNHRIPDFELPEWVYKPSTVYGDGVKLHLMSQLTPNGINEDNYIVAPWASDGAMAQRARYDVAPWGENQAVDKPLLAFFYGNTVTFNRPLRDFEAHRRIAACDVQRRISLIHVCDDSCPLDADGHCRLIEDRILTEIPDPNYVVMLTAARHASGSPPAAQRAMELNDAATKILSAMRSNDVAHTTPDIVPHDDLRWVGVY